MPRHLSQASWTKSYATFELRDNAYACAFSSTLFSLYAASRTFGSQFTALAFEKANLTFEKAKLAFRKPNLAFLFHELCLAGMLLHNPHAPNAAVFAAYAWSSDLSDEEILEKLLALNLERAKG